MKKIFLALMAVLAFSFSLKAQQYVSTTPSNRNVILEEFTGRNCGYCPDGHVIANQIAAANPGRFWAMNIHAGGFSPTSFPNLNTPDGLTINNGFGISSYPNGVVNRTTATGIGRNQWAGAANTQLGQAAECNVGGMVVVNPATHLATITVEVYYTGNSSQSTNYLTIAMLQDSIWGSQSSGSSNPSQWNGSEYCHMHVLRDIITDVWGDAITPTTEGSLVTRTYTYEIPEQIGSPNPVEVDLENIFFLAYVTEQYQGTPTRPVLNANKLDMVTGSDEPIFPFFKGVTQESTTTCTHTKIIEARIQNGGTETLTSMKIEAELEGETVTINWEGELPQYGLTTVEIPVEVPFGSHNVVVRVTEANGTPFSAESNASVSCQEWTDLEIEGEETEIELQLMQDKFGNQITWEATASDGTVLASGGPYAMLMGGTGTQLQIERFNVPANECVKFAIYDNVGNGICCSYGHGYFILYDENDNVLFGDEDDGEFGSEASVLISVKGPGIEATVGETDVEVVNDVDANFISSLDYAGYPDEVGFEYRKVTSSEVNTVEGIINEFKSILASVTGLDESSIYMVKAYAIIQGQTFYGPEATFNTGTTGVNEFENSVKVYPNPASNVLNVAGANIAKVEVYNAMGQHILSQEVAEGQAQISTESMNSGIYFVRIYSQNGEMQTRMFSVAK